MQQIIRPVGNRIKLSKRPFNEDVLKPFKFIGFESGTSALAIALQLVKSNRNDILKPEVLLPAYTCPDVISACIYADVKPVLVDFEENIPRMDIKQLKSKLNLSTIAVIAINFLGIPERIDLIRDLKKKYRFEVIEDSAQGMPLESPDKYWQGDLIVTSFGRGKPLNLLGGGALLLKEPLYSKYLEQTILTFTLNSQNQSLLKRISYSLKILLFNILSKPVFYFYLTRLPFLKLGVTTFKPLTSVKNMSAGIKNNFMINYSNYKVRKQPVFKYMELFSKLKCEEIITIPSSCKITEAQPLLRFPILIQNKQLYNKIYAALIEKNLGVSKMYSKILPNITGVDNTLFSGSNNFPNASIFASQLITFPTHEDITGKVIKSIENVFTRELNNLRVE